MTAKVKPRILDTAHTAYLKQLREMPRDAPEWWPKHMVELLSLQLIQRIGNTIYLTERGQEVASKL